MSISLSLPQDNGTAPTYHKVTKGIWALENGTLCVQYSSYLDAAHFASTPLEPMSCKETSQQFFLLLAQFSFTVPTEAQIDDAVIALANSPLAGGTQTA
jgi:hypothetical protein